MTAIGNDLNNGEKLSRILFGNKYVSNYLEETQTKNATISSQDKKPAWHDEDDDNVEFLKNKVNTGEQIVQKYSDVLKRRFNTLIGTPEWAQLDQKKRVDSDSDEDDTLQSIGHLHKRQRSGLKQGTIEIKRCPKLNSETCVEGPIIKAVEFHPSSSVSLVAGFSGHVSLFAVDGRNNYKLHGVSLKNFKVHTARFSRCGSEAFLGSNENYFYIYNLMKGDTFKVMLPNSIAATTKFFEISRCGKYLAITGRFGEIHLMCAKSRELLFTFKQSDPVTALTFDNEGKYLYGHSSTGVITIFNISALKPQYKWADHGCISGSSLALSPCGEYFVCGSAEGVANIYNHKDIFLNNPEPIRTILNLNTRIDNIRFNTSSEILGISSSMVNNGIKLIHLPSFHVFSNFPGAQSNFRQVNCFNFSPNCGYIGIGNNKNNAYLHRLKYYSNY